MPQRAWGYSPTSGGGGVGPTPSFVQVAAGQSTTSISSVANPISATLASPPTPGNMLVAVYGALYPGAAANPQPNQTGFECMGQWGCGPTEASGNSDVGIVSAFRRTVETGDGDTWSFSPGTGPFPGLNNYLQELALYEVTPFGRILSSLGTYDQQIIVGSYNTVAGGLMLSPSYCDCFAIAAGFNVPPRGDPVGFPGTNTPAGPWPVTADEVIYDSTATNWSAMTTVSSQLGAIGPGSNISTDWSVNASGIVDQMYLGLLLVLLPTGV
jgi:hypothetical protein